MLTYFIQMIACSGILYAYYHFFLRNEKFHQYNRFYLLLSMLLSLLLPFLKIPVEVKNTNASAIYTFVSAGETVVVTATENRFDFAQLLYIIYGCIVAGMTLKLIKAVVQIIRIKKNGVTVKAIGGIQFVRTPHPDAPFSFFNWLFWNERIELESTEGSHMFRHELYHIRSKHSWDLIFMEIILSICWFNPFFYLYRKEVKTIQEFLADRYATRDSDTSSYAQILLLRAMGAAQLTLINPFFHNQLKRRITMLTSSKKPRYQWFRKLLVLPVATTAIALFAFTYKASVEEKSAQLQSRQDIWLQSQERLSDKVKVYNSHSAPVDTLSSPQKFFVNGKEVTKEKFKSLDTQQIKRMTFSSKNENGIRNVWVDLKPEGEIAVATIAADQKEIFTRVEIEAEYQGNWNSFLTRNLNSKIAMENGANPGKYEVQLTFVVDETGNVTDVKAISNNGYKMEEEAIRVIRKSGKWKPAIQNGKEVASYHNQSITFTSSSQNIDQVTPPSSGNLSQKEPEVFTKVEIDAAYPGNWRSFLERNLNAVLAVENGAKPGTYTTIIQFIVDKGGTVSDIKPLTKHGYGMEEEAMRVIKVSGKWKPAIQNGREVKAYRKQPITFQISKN